MVDSPNRCWSRVPSLRTETGARRGARRRRHTAVWCAIALATAGIATAEAPAPEPTRCLPDGSGYLRARLAGAIEAEIDWSNDNMACTGGTRPNEDGLRVVFTQATDADQEGNLVLLFGIAGVTEGHSGRDLPVNVTIIRQGMGEFYGTQGDDRCFVDELTQEPLLGIPRRQRAYRVVARGFCMQPARAVRGEGSVLMSRFDYAGRVDYLDAPGVDDAALAQRVPRHGG